MIETKITQMLGIKYPIVGGTMMWISNADFVAAISNAGGLGVLASAMYDSREAFADAIDRIRELTDKPFCVNINLFPAMRQMDNNIYMEVLEEKEVKIVETSGHSAPEELCQRFKQAGMTWIHKCVGVRYAQKVQDETGQHYPVFWIGVGAIVGVPLIAFFILGMPVAWDVPELKGFNFKGGMVIRPEFIALWLALSGYTAAFIGEIVRAGITAVNYGQTEAASALGLSRGRTLNLVVIPQALRIIVPPLTSQYLNLTKNSSLAVAIGYMDIVATIGGISLNQTGREMECMIIVLALYLTLSLLISAAMNWYNNRIKLVER